MTLWRLLLPLPVLLATTAGASYGDCSCSCCAKIHPNIDCVPVSVGYNRLSSCSACSTAVCAKQWPLACPVSPTTGGKHNFGGHTTFTCDGYDEGYNTSHGYDSERPYTGGSEAGLLIVALLVLGCCFCRLCQRRKAPRWESGPGDGAYSAFAQGTVPMGVAVPRTDGYGYVTPGVVNPQPTVVLQQPTVVVQQVRRERSWGDRFWGGSTYERHYGGSTHTHYSGGGWGGGGSGGAGGQSSHTAGGF